MDLSILLVAGSLAVGKQSRARCPNSDIKNELRFLFREDNCQLLEWGSISIPKDGQMVPFPGMYQKISSEHLWRRYSAEHRHCDGEGETVGSHHTRFITVVDTLTRPE